MLKVKDLIQKLNQLDPNLNLLFMCEDKNITPEGYMIRVFELLEVQKKNAVTSREDRIVTVNFNKDPHATPFACIELTSDI